MKKSVKKTKILTFGLTVIGTSFCRFGRSVPARKNGFSVQYFPEIFPQRLRDKPARIRERPLEHRTLLVRPEVPLAAAAAAAAADGAAAVAADGALEGGQLRDQVHGNFLLRLNQLKH